MKLIRISALVLALLLMVTVFGGCGKGDDAASGGGSGEMITVAKDGETAYSIIKPEKYTENELSAAMTIFKQYKDKFGVSMPNKTDDVETDAPEIIIGQTNRPETKVAKELLLATRDSKGTLSVVKKEKKG